MRLGFLHLLTKHTLTGQWHANCVRILPNNMQNRLKRAGAKWFQMILPLLREDMICENVFRASHFGGSLNDRSGIPNNLFSVLSNLNLDAFENWLTKIFLGSRSVRLQFTFLPVFSHREEISGVTLSPCSVWRESYEIMPRLQELSVE
jgi:hypothetical protein